MRISKAILYGAILWVFIFFEVSILMFGFGLEDGPAYYIIHYILAIILVTIVTLLYFRKGKADFGKGILAGILFAFTGLFLDSIITVPLFVKDYSLMFGNYMLWIGIIIGILTAGIVGAIKKK